MATDAYIKFGEGSELAPNQKDKLPLIEGDSTDEGHYWWCELRGYDFSLDAGEQHHADSDSTPDKEKPKPSFKKVTIKKRVDWASTKLFMKCIYAAQATARKLTGPEDLGRIDQVTIEICKQAAAGMSDSEEARDQKFPFVTVKYHGVRIVGYEIDIQKPEPDETISFVFEKLDVEYEPTDPYTGRKIKGGTARAMDVQNYAAANNRMATNGTTSGVGTAGTTASASASAAAAGAAGSSSGNGNGAASSDGTLPGDASPTEAAANANFPGLWTGTGFGILPD